MVPSTADGTDADPGNGPGHPTVFEERAGDDDAEEEMGLPNPVGRYLRWLHTQWPAGHVEKLPEVRPDGSTNVVGLYVVGDLTGVPLLKLALDGGARAVQSIVADPSFARRSRDDGALDLVIVGAGVSGMAAALEARERDLHFEIVEASEPFSTIVNFPKAKPIFTYPTDMTPAGELQFTERSSVKEGLLEELREETLGRGIRPRAGRAERVARRNGLLEVSLAGGEVLRAHRVIVGIGRSGNFRRLGVPGEDQDKVYNRLHDPRDFRGQNVLVVGGGDSALETAVALAASGAHVTLSYRKRELSRPKPENVERLWALTEDPGAEVGVEDPSSERVTTAAGGFMGGGHDPGSVRLMLGSAVKEIRETAVVIVDAEGREETLDNDAVFPMIGREAPLGFFRRSGVPITGEIRPWGWASLAAFVVFCTWLYHWKSGHALPFLGPLPKWLNPDPARWWAALEGAGGALGAALKDPATLLGTLRISASGPSFYYTLAYSLIVVIFGIRRVRRRCTPYVRVQTLTLAAIQVLPLFLLPELLLPWLGHNGWFDGGWLGRLADALFPVVSYGHGREYWRAYGLVLAWPLNVYNWFTPHPLWGWLALGFAQTFVVIPVLVYFWGKGAYCGWICSCGALAETLGDTHRQKMPHGPFWNRLNGLGQGVLASAAVLMLLRIAGWVWPRSPAAAAFAVGFDGYAWTVDLFLAGIVCYGLYFWFSGRVWCRFACPLAALMHVYARFSRFRILAEKKKCISCNVCTSVCHQGIDVMSFANKGLPMADPECVRCSACVQHCPTGVLSFGQIDRRTGDVLSSDPPWLVASPVRRVELRVRGA
jgi:NosR/NirI family nitrous oxide reductase transcriptional regulator